MKIKNLLNIESAFKQTRLLAIIAVVGAFLYSVIVSLVAINMVSKAKGKIYITNGYGNTLSAYQILSNQNRSAETKAHVRNFHFLLYDITPNPEIIKTNLDKVLLMGDASVKTFLDKRGDAYYKKLIASNIEIKYQCDSVKVNMKNYPYRGVQYGKEIIESPVGSLVKNLVSRMDIREVKRTDKNPHGLLIGNYEVLQNNRVSFTELED